VHAHFGGDRTPRADGKGPHGWLDLPVEVTRQRRDEINAWAVGLGYYQYMAQFGLFGEPDVVPRRHLAHLDIASNYVT
jgi:hypothetical protein